MRELLPLSGTDRPNERWQFLRDVLVFQFKMVVDNLRDFALIPVSLGAALLDLLFKGEREGALFYQVLRWGAHSEKIIDVYSPLERESFQTSAGIGSDGPQFTIDAAIARLERVVLREVEKGGTAATVKAAMDRAMDQLHNETGAAREKATGLVSRAAQKVQATLSPESRRDE